MTSPYAYTSLLTQPLIAPDIEGFSFSTAIASDSDATFITDDSLPGLPFSGSWAASEEDAFAMNPASLLPAPHATGRLASPYALPIPIVRLDRSQYWADRLAGATLDEGLHAIADAFAQRDGSSARAILGFVDREITLELLPKCFRERGLPLQDLKKRPLPMGDALYAARLEDLQEGLRTCDEKILVPAATDICDLQLHYGIDCGTAVPLLLAPFKDGTFDVRLSAGLVFEEGSQYAIARDSFVNALSAIGDRLALRPLLDFFARGENWRITGTRSEVDEGILWGLRQLGASEGQLAKLRASPKPELEFENPMHQAAYAVIASGRGAKQRVFEGARVINALPDPQAWITINDPALAQEAVKVLLRKIGDKRSAFDNLLAAAIDVRSTKLDQAHFTYFADEILDAVSAFAAQSRCKDDADLQQVLSRIRFGGDIRLRFVGREEEDLSLGDRCGDCTAKGSINFENSVTWLVNPAYQILKLSRGNRFLGRINLTLGTLAGKEVIIIDALEFNPQAQQGKPYYNDAKQALSVAVEFLRELAKREHRALAAFTQSNSGEANELLKEWGESDKGSASLRLLSPEEDVARVLATGGYRGEVRLFYQMIENVNENMNENVDEAIGNQARPSGDLTDAKLPELERAVVNPAQIADTAVATAMRARDFEQAARLILMHPEWAAEVRRIFGLPAKIGLSPEFLARRMEKMYPVQSVGAGRLGRSFAVDLENFSWLARK